MSQTLHLLWQRASTTTSAPHWWLEVAASVLAAALVFASGPRWGTVRMAVTVAHEGAHALVGVLTGRRLTGITLHQDTSGLTVTVGSAQGLSTTLTGFVGYPGPAMLGAAMWWATTAGHAATVGAVLTVLLALMLLFIRNGRGLAVLLGAVAAAASAWWYLPVAVLAFVLCALAAFLTAGAARTLHEERRARLGGASTDVSMLAASAMGQRLWWALMVLALIVPWYYAIR